MAFVDYSESLGCAGEPHGSPSLWSRPQWQNVSFGPDYRVTYRMAGARIIVGQPNGKASLDGLRQALGLLEEIVSNEVPKDQKFVFIEDYSQLQSATLDARRFYIGYMASHPQVQAIVFCGISAFFRMSIKLGQALTVIRFPIALCDTLAEALSRARHLVASASGPTNPNQEPGGLETRDKTDALRPVAGDKRQKGCWRSPLRLGNRSSEARIDGQVGAVLDYLARFDMDAEENLAPVSRPPAEPVFLPIYDAIDLIKSDLRQHLTQRYRTEQVLRENEERYRKIIEGISDGYYEMDLNGCLVFANLSLGRMLGHEGNRLAGLAKTALFASQTMARMEKAFATVLHTGAPALSCDWEMIRRDGTPIRVEASISLIRHADGRPKGFCGIIRDVTDRKRQEDRIRHKAAVLKDKIQRRTEDLRLAEEKSWAIIDNIEEGYFEVNLAGNYTFHNEALARMVGLEGQRLIDLNFRDVVRVQEAEAIKSAFHRVFETGQPLRHQEGTIVTHDGRLRHLESSVSLIRDEKGQPIGFRGIVRDVTERKALVAELERQRQKAEEASTAKSRFLANISHEIRTPLNGIIGMTELIRTEDLSEENLDFFQTIANESAMLLDIVNQVLDYSKIEAGKMELETVTFDPNALLGQIAKSMALQAAIKGLAFHSDVAPIAVHLGGDPVRLRQIINNLAANALRFTHQGHIRLSCRVVAETAERLTLHIGVSDTGIGIAADKLETIFDSFTQADGSTTRKFGGTGLGTTIAKQLVESMGGRIGVHSRPGEGSTFWFHVPLAKTVEKAAPVTINAAPVASRTVSPAVQGMATPRILLVEDYATNQQVALRHLTDAGYAVDLAENGLEALGLFQQRPYDLILMDVQMPVMDGLTAAARIRALETDSAQTGHHTPIVALTGHTARADIDQCLAAGMDDYLTKPLRRKVLLDMAARWTGTAEPPAKTAKEPDHAPTRTAAPLDLTLALAEFENDAGFFDSVLDSYIHQAGTQIEAIRQALTCGDAEGVRQQAHALRGGAANLTAGDLAAAAAALENAGRHGHLAESADLLNDLEVQYHRLKAWEAQKSCC